MGNGRESADERPTKGTSQRLRGPRSLKPCVWRQAIREKALKDQQKGASRALSNKSGSVQSGEKRLRLGRRGPLRLGQLGGRTVLKDQQKGASRPLSNKSSSTLGGGGIEG